MGTAGTTTYFVKMFSDASTVMAKDKASADAFSGSIDKLNSKVETNTKVTTKSRKSKLLLSNAMDKVTKAIESERFATVKDTLAKRLNAIATNKVGLNVGALSLRISQSLLPALGLAYTAMLPVAAGLLAIASAAVVATAGVAGLVGVGLYAWSKQFAKSGQYQGARQPYQGAGSQQDFMKEVMKGFESTLSDPAIKSKIEKAVEWTKVIFQETLPNAFKAFIDNIDMSVMERLITMFNDYLPNAMGRLAQWGQKLFQTIGEESLGAMNRAISFIAQGLQNVAEWLAGGGMGQVEEFISIIIDLGKAVFELGKDVLPVLNRVLGDMVRDVLIPAIKITQVLVRRLAQSPKLLWALSAAVKLIAIAAIIATTPLLKLIAGLAWLVSMIFGVSSAMVALTSALILLGTAGLLYVSTKVEEVKSFLVNLGSFILNIFVLIGNGIIKILNKVGEALGIDMFANITEIEPFKFMDREGNLYDDFRDIGGRRQEVDVKVSVDDDGMFKYIEDGAAKSIYGSMGGVTPNTGV